MLATQTSRRRGLTVLELMIGLAILGAFAVGAVLFIVRHTSTFDLEGAAQEWASKLDYHFVSSTCTNSLAEGNYVRCTVRVLEVKEPIPLECSVVSQNCSMMRASR